MTIGVTRIKKTVSPESTRPCIHAFTHARTQTADDRVEIIGTQRVEWRRVLQTGYLSLTLELTGLGGDTSVPVGTLNLNLELLPKVVNTLTSEADLSAQVALPAAPSRAAVPVSYTATPVSTAPHCSSLLAAAPDCPRLLQKALHGSSLLPTAGPWTTGRGLRQPLVPCVQSNHSVVWSAGARRARATRGRRSALLSGRLHVCASAPSPTSSLTDPMTATTYCVAFVLLLQLLP